MPTSEEGEGCLSTGGDLPTSVVICVLGGVPIWGVCLLAPTLGGGGCLLTRRCA